jgi:isoleucyl-tRNA synthetase
MKYTLNMQKVSFNLNEKFLDKSSYLECWNSQEMKDFLEQQRHKPLFLLHDGPPYANGDLHLGHFTNKVLKDTVLKFKRLNGYYAPFNNGFDCHGLPVELAVEKLNSGKTNKQEFLNQCYQYSNEQVANQLAQLKEFGMLADFDNSYKTNEFFREAEEMEAVLNLLDKDYLYQKFRPVHWCKDCQSSLAEAEVEYKVKTSDSVTVEFKLNDDTYLLVWTTTPYTLPANQAVAYNKRFTYAKYYNKAHDKYYVTLKNDALDSEMEFVTDVDLDNLVVQSPYSKKMVPLLQADFVENSGTGFVHVAPSFGLDDFYLGENHHLDVNSYVDNYGKYDSVEFPELQGMNLKDSAASVLATLQADNLVFKLTKLEHEYPHCWRHKSPLFSKASKEWFMDLSNVKEKALEEVEDVRFFPSNGKNRLTSMLATRNSWCVSRNRLWGVPLPKDKTPEALNEYRTWVTFVKHNGLSSLYTEDFSAQTLDVWFDSGMTHTTVMKRNYGTTQSDLYLEGSDQHRGWFQSSLLTSTALNNKAPYKQVFTHGFVVDSKGMKFSKSLGNYVALQDLLKQHSPDVLRLWCLNQDYHKELTYSESTLQAATEMYKKFRNTYRFMLQNLYDYTPESVLKTQEMDLLDKYVLHETNELKKTVLKLGDEYKFNEALTVLYAFCDRLSVLYFEANKDRLYCLAPDAPRRRLTQSVLNYVQHNLMVLLSTYLPYSTEEYYRSLNSYSGLSVFMEELLDDVTVDFDQTSFNKVLELRDVANKLFEEGRTSKVMSKNNEMVLHLNSDLNDEQQTVLSVLLGSVSVVKHNKTELFKHDFKKCDRCWNYFKQLCNDNLCQSCNDVEKQ